MAKQYTIEELKAMTNLSDEVETLPQRWDTHQRDILGDVFILHSFESIETAHGKAYVGDCQFYDGHLRVLLGGQVLMEQMDILRGSLPVALKVIKPGRAYLFSEPTERELVEFANALQGGDSQEIPF